MAKHSGKCPKCGAVLEVDTAVGEQIVCPRCQASLGLPDKSKLSDRVDPLIGHTLGEFEILELLGRGGMGAVYKARQASLDRLVAVKTLPRAFSSDARYVARFRREARSAAAVRHPNIIEIHAVGEAEGYPFIAMEFIDGETLGALLKREGRLEPQRAIDLLRQTASALERAHEAGILHRDIKPANILIDNHGLVKVADFGLAKREHGDVSVTQTGHVLGTVLYMPPETARGEPFDARSDLYSLGATFYHALAGRAPFEAGTTAELVLKHVEAAPAMLQQVAPDCPPALCRVVHRLLRKKPAERYESAEKLLEALAKVEARRSVDQAAATATGPAPQGISRRTRPVGGACPRRVFPKWLSIALPAAAAILVLILVIVLSSSPKHPPAAVARPTTRTPTKKHRPPSRPSAAAERNAATVFNNARACISRKDHIQAQDYLDRLRAQYGKTNFVASHEADIAALQKQIHAPVKPIPKPSTPKPEPPPPQPPNPEPAPEAAAEARWKQLKGRTEKLTGDGDFEEAKKLLESAAEIKLKDIAERVAEAKKKVAAAQRDARDRAVAAYAEQSDKLWLLFKEREYADAEKLLAGIVGGASLPREHLAADQEALKLLKAFWATVERNLAAKKGDFIAFGGAGGKIVEAKDGQVTVRGTRDTEFRLSIYKLSAKQALHYSGLKPKRDPSSKLMTAVLFLADGTALDEAAEALEKAGDAPSVAIYRERLDALQMCAAEARRRQKVAAEALGVDIEQVTEIAKDVKITLVLIPAGEFLMGSPPTTSPEQLDKAFGGGAHAFRPEFPQHRVKISKPFWLGKTEVTQAQWKAVMGSNPSEFKGKPQNPVEDMSWDDCQGFLQELSAKLKAPFRLPTEAQWEYACRAGSATEFYFGDSQADLPHYAWFKGNSGYTTHPVGQKKPNAWGLHDMVGNVWEWCEDGYAEYGRVPQVDPKTNGLGWLVLRGGSWNDIPGSWRSAFRHRRPCIGHGASIGFRLARGL